MKVQENIKKCVAFVAIKMADNSFRLIGTVFFVGRDTQKNKYTYAVTAKHVIEGAANKGLEMVYLRMNMSNGQLGIFSTNVKDWIYHQNKNVDIAVHPIGLSGSLDHLLYPESEFVTTEFIKQNEIDVGDEVIITGLFKHHQGTNKNLPIIRIGNIASMGDEKVQTRDAFMDAYLIEARSIGGLSGSPVFINLGIIRKLGGQIKHRKGDDFHNLLGLIHGHCDSKVSQVDEVNEDLEESERVNTGIAIVTPITKLAELFEQEEIKLNERKVDTKIAQKEQESQHPKSE